MIHKGKHNYVVDDDDDGVVLIVAVLVEGSVVSLVVEILVEGVNIDVELLVTGQQPLSTTSLQQP